ncbi:hypothetical protein [Streptomyces resistomycificus]|uniref:Gram-positive cocci surface proteins LPxTG domain-containing protein n=1 Tax=Streptomyces resistomycificus TaxID=67356 RepID=A0A0L8LDW5_9ACTN|nr:hypothetical protein [Streptomyces resistomycificus]KOG36468.1 hypothetical protein ADK37_13825 [Streptomyces resistomycificus]KUN92412.1 hypothetical protein AQJ84_33580 [Streptomyces resistomycificus]
MRSKCTVFGAVLAAVVLALTPSASSAADGPSAKPSPLPTQAYATIDAEKQLNVGSATQSVHVGWGFWDDGAQVPVPTNDTLVIDTRDLAGIASVTVDDPRCKDGGRVITCANTGSSQSRSVDFTVRADAGAATGADGTITYTLSADHATGTTAKARVVVGIPKLIVGRLPDVTHARVGSRVDVRLRLRNTGDLATDRRVMLSWESVGGLVFDRRFSNCAYGDSHEPSAPGSQVSVTCVFPVGPDSVPAGATMELSSPLTATVGKHVLTAVTDYSAELLKPGVEPGGGSHQGTGPALTLVRASGAGSGFEKGAEGRFTVAADNSADFAAEATPKPGSGAGAWTLDINALNHGPASAYGIDDKAATVVDVVLPKGAVATGNVHMEEEDSPYGPCLLRNGSTSTAPFEAGHRHYVCTVPFGLDAGKSQLFVLMVKTSKAYDGAKGTATVRPGPAGIPFHDPDASNDSVTFAFGKPATPTAAEPSGDTLDATGADRTTLIATAAGCAALLGGVAIVVRHRRRSH